MPISRCRATRGSRPRIPTSGAHPLLVLFLVVAALIPVGADTAVAGADVGCTKWQRPSLAAVVDPFRPPAHIGAPGNRGWEFGTGHGDRASAAAPGVVTFAGWVGGRRHVTVAHCDGFRTTYSWLARIDVETGEWVARGQTLGTTGGPLHFGVRRAGAYVDPAGLFSEPRVRIRLVPLGSRRVGLR